MKHLLSERYVALDDSIRQAVELAQPHLESERLKLVVNYLDHGEYRLALETLD